MEAKIKKIDGYELSTFVKKLLPIDKFIHKYPELPSEYWSVMSKYYFKEPFTKKQLKNDLKKLKKKGHCKNLQGLHIIHKKVRIEFD